MLEGLIQSAVLHYSLRHNGFRKLNSTVFGRNQRHLSVRDRPDASFFQTHAFTGQHMASKPLLVSGRGNEPLGEEVGNLGGQPRPHPERHCMRDAKLWHITLPKRIKVDREANFAAAVHLGGLAVEFWKGQLGGGGRVRDGDIKLEVKFKLLHLVHIPNFAGPHSPLHRSTFRSGCFPRAAISFRMRRVL
jgi:hypothetical protein